MGTVYRMAVDSADRISLDMGYQTGGFRGFSPFFTQIEAFEGCSATLLNPCVLTHFSTKLPKILRLTSISELLELNDGWIGSFSPEKKPIEYYLQNNGDTAKEHFYEVNFVKNDFWGMSVHFYISILKKTENRISEPFKYIAIDIKSEVDKWFCEGVFIDSLSGTRNKKYIEGFRRKAWKLEGVDSDLSEKIYKKLISLNDAQSYWRYARLLRKQQKYEEAIKNFKEALRRYGPGNKEPDDDAIIQIKYDMALSYCKIKKYDAALQAMEEIENYLVCDKKKNFGKIFYFLVLLRKKFGYDFTEIDNYLSEKSGLKTFDERISEILDRTEKKQLLVY